MAQVIGLDETGKIPVVKKTLVKHNRSDASKKGDLKTRKLSRLRRRNSWRFEHTSYDESPEKASPGLKDICKMCGNLFLPKTLLENPNRPSLIVEKLSVCDSCETIVTSDLPLHPDQVLQCNVCSKLFTTDKALKIHSRVHKKGFKCSVCCREFSSETYLKTHMEKHKDWKPHQCDVCSKRFFHGSWLEEHLLKHSGERRLKCEVCGKICLYYGGLMLHMNGHVTSGSIGFESDLDTANYQRH